MKEETKKKSYTKPKVIHEAKLEVRAGTPVTGGLIDPLDPGNAKKP
jgi:hypothetical protein